MRPLGDRASRLRAGALAALIALGLAGGLSVAAGGGAASARAANEGSGGPAAQPPTPTTADRALHGELEQLAEAWSLGGGRFGFPFWEKAMQRWRSGELSTALFREYVTGYRDRLRAGCRLVDATDVDADAARDVRSLLADSCRRRLDALRAQQRWLDALVQRALASSSRAPAEDPATPADEAAEAGAAAQRLAATAAEQEAEYREAIQESYRDARLAMDLAQLALDDAGVARLPEDAFV